MQSPSQIYSLMSLEFNYGTVTKGFLWSQNYGLMYFSMAYSAAFVVLSLTKWFPRLGRSISWSTAYRCLHLLAQRHIRINAQIYMFFLVLLCCQKQLPPQSRRGLTLLLNIKQNITLCYEKTFFYHKNSLICTFLDSDTIFSILLLYASTIEFKRNNNETYCSRGLKEIWCFTQDNRWLCIQLTNFKAVKETCL